MYVILIVFALSSMCLQGAGSAEAPEAGRSGVDFYTCASEMQKTSKTKIKELPDGSKKERSLKRLRDLKIPSVLEMSAPMLSVVRSGNLIDRKVESGLYTSKGYLALYEKATEKDCQLLKASIAHELGHVHHGHPEKLFNLMIAQKVFTVIAGGMGVAFALRAITACGKLQAAMGGVPWYKALFSKAFLRSAIGRQILYFTGGLAGLGALFFFGRRALARRYEYQADAWAAELVGAEPAQQMLQNLETVFPQKAWATWFYSHPTMKNRIKALQPKVAVQAATAA